MHQVLWGCLHSTMARTFDRKLTLIVVVFPKQTFCVCVVGEEGKDSGRKGRRYAMVRSELSRWQTTVEVHQNSPCSWREKFVLIVYARKYTPWSQDCQIPVLFPVLSKVVVQWMLILTNHTHLFVYIAYVTGHKAGTFCVNMVQVDSAL